MSYTTVQLPYGKSQIAFELPTSNLLGVFYPKVDTEARDEDQIVREVWRIRSMRHACVI